MSFSACVVTLFVSFIKTKKVKENEGLVKKVQNVHNLHAKIKLKQTRQTDKPTEAQKQKQ